MTKHILVEYVGSNTYTYSFIEKHKGSSVQVDEYDTLAKELDATNTNCIDCINCTNCTNCTNCINCTNCTNCTDCTECTNCVDCYQLADCSISTKKMEARKKEMLAIRKKYQQYFVHINETYNKEKKRIDAEYKASAAAIEKKYKEGYNE